MELIRKKICLESLRTRTPGLVPYIPFNSAVTEGTVVSASTYNGNWGQFAYNFVNESGETVNYLSMMGDYYTMRGILKDGLKLKRIQKDSKYFYTDNFNDTPILYDYTPHIIDDFVVDENGLYYNNDADDDYINLLSAGDYQTYLSLGGIEQCLTVENYIGIYTVPSAITGDMVPVFMYYSEIPEWVNWFATNEAKANGGLIYWYFYTTTNQETYWTLVNPKDIAEGYSITIYDNINGEYKVYKCISVADDIYGFIDDNGNTLVLIYEDYKTINIKKDCCIAKEWDDRGGYPMWEELKNMISAVGQKLAWWNERIDTLVKPTIDIPVLLTQNSIDPGILSPYDESEDYTVEVPNYHIWISEDQSDNVKVLYSVDRNPIEGKIRAHYTIPTDSGAIPTQFTVIDVTERNGETMKMKLFGFGQWFFYGGEIINNATPDSKELPSDEDITVESHLQTLRRYEKTYDDEGNLCPFYLVGNSNTEIPFAAGEEFNVYYNEEEKIYDTITSIRFYDKNGRETTERSEYDRVLFEYSMGVKEDPDAVFDAGIRYEESYPCWIETYDIPVNGTDGLEYVFIDFGSMSSTIYNRDFNLSRTGNIAKLKGMKTYDIWNSEEATTTAAYKEEFLDRVSEKPDIKVDIEVDRGNASAFERHLKLNEINTFADLENYGNNFYGV